MNIDQRFDDRMYMSHIRRIEKVILRISLFYQIKNYSWSIISLSFYCTVPIRNSLKVYVLINLDNQDVCQRRDPVRECVQHNRRRPSLGR